MSRFALFLDYTCDSNTDSDTLRGVAVNVQDLWLKLDAEAYELMHKSEIEYGSSKDRLRNFNAIGEFLERPAREVLLVFFMKHVLSISTGISLREPMRGRVIDAMNYLRLLVLMEHLEGQDEDNRCGADLSPVSNGHLPEVPTLVGPEQTLEEARGQAQSRNAPRYSDSIRFGKSL